MPRSGLIIGAIVAVASIAPAAAQDRGLLPPPLVGYPGRPFADRADQEPPRSLVLIEGFNGALHAYGCGVIVGETASTITIVTAAHNLTIERAAFVTASGERLRLRTSQKVADHDLALVTADRPGRVYAVAGLAPSPALGARIRVWGPVADRPFTLQDGVIREIDARVTGTPDGAFAVDCAACGRGDSGTGVFDERGRLVGIVTRTYFTRTPSGERQRLFVLGERYRPDGGAPAYADAAP